MALESGPRLLVDNDLFHPDFLEDYLDVPRRKQDVVALDQHPMA